MKIKISELELAVATDALETLLEMTTPDNEAAERNREIMERVHKRFLKLKESSEKKGGQDGYPAVSKGLLGLPRSDRENVRNQLYSIADQLRKAYNMTVPEIRRFLHEMIDSTV